MNDIVFHIGYPKSASTTLQEKLFMRLPDTYYLGVGMGKFPGNNNQIVLDNTKKLFSILFKKDNLNYDHFETLDYWTNVKKHIPSNIPIIISNEKAL